MGLFGRAPARRYADHGKPPVRIATLACAMNVIYRGNQRCLWAVAGAVHPRKSAAKPLPKRRHGTREKPGRIGPWSSGARWSVSWMGSRKAATRACSRSSAATAVTIRPGLQRGPASGLGAQLQERERVDDQQELGGDEDDNCTLDPAGRLGVIHRAGSGQQARPGGSLAWDAPVNWVPLTGLSMGVRG